MSQISRELQEQQGDMGAVMKRLFPHAAAIDAETERKRVEAEANLNALREQLSDKSQSR